MALGILGFPHLADAAPAALQGLGEPLQPARVDDRFCRRAPRRNELVLYEVVLLGAPPAYGMRGHVELAALQGHRRGREQQYQDGAGAALRRQRKATQAACCHANRPSAHLEEQQPAHHGAVRHCGAPRRAGAERGGPVVRGVPCGRDLLRRRDVLGVREHAPHALVAALHAALPDVVHARALAGPQIGCQVPLLASNRGSWEVRVASQAPHRPDAVIVREVWPLVVPRLQAQARKVVKVHAGSCAVLSLHLLAKPWEAVRLLWQRRVVVEGVATETHVRRRGPEVGALPRGLAQVVQLLQAREDGVHAILLAAHRIRGIFFLLREACGLRPGGSHQRGVRALRCIQAGSRGHDEEGKHERGLAAEQRALHASAPAASWICFSG
mmetsp:Transcript_8335/g.22285  ORF Transcript_8335/g.22285 Transcript_8335/m.22285 type:complete len:384 (+) Transcript_8335:800-1951(+)